MNQFKATIIYFAYSIIIIGLGVFLYEVVFSQLKDQPASEMNNALSITSLNLFISSKLNILILMSYVFPAYFLAIHYNNNRLFNTMYFSINAMISTIPATILIYAAVILTREMFIYLVN